MTMALDTSIDYAKLADLIIIGIQRARREQRSVLVSHTERVPTADPLALFVAGQALGEPIFYWEQASEAFAIVGIGTAVSIEQNGQERFADTAAAWRDLLDHAVIDGLDTLPGSGPTLLGGFAFDPQRQRTATWHGFADASVVVPCLQITASGSTYSLTYNVLVNAESDPQFVTEHVAHLYTTLLDVPSLPMQFRRLEQLQQRDCMPAVEWQAIVAETVAAIRRGELEKVALARSVRVIAAQPFELHQVLAQLHANYPTAYVFAISRGERCFIGATPERLVGLRAGVVQASGLAGTAPRGSTPVEDQRLGEELLASSKNRHEHAVVVDMLRSALDAVCVDVYAPATPRLLKLSNVQHLYTPVSGRLKRSYSLLDLVAQLHPTPAVGGLPNAPALEHIRSHEQLDRGWYAGPIGWLDARGEGDFAVALRSGVVAGAEATLFAGCGIVAASDPRHEYAETMLKLQPMLTALAAGAI